MQNPLALRNQNVKDVIYVGTVVNGNDPQKMGRVTVRVPHIFDNVADGDLPWAIPDRMTGPAGNVGGSASCMVPLAGSKVYVFFQLGNIHSPIYSTDILNTQFFASTVFGSEYPNAWGFSDGANYIKVNRVTGDVLIQNAAGDIINLATDGTINITATKDLNVNVTGTTTVNSPTVVVNASTSATVTSPVVQVTASTSATITSGGSSVTVTPGTISLDNGAGATVSLIGGIVDLNM